MTVKNLIKEIKPDLNSDRHLRIKFVLSSFFLNPSFRLLLNYRLGKYFNSSRWKLYRFLSYRYHYSQITKRNCLISYNAIIGKGVRFPHPLGIVIGDGVIIKDNVTIWQQVTLGSHGKMGQPSNYHVIGNNIKLFAGAKYFGTSKIGDNSIVGANAVVLKDIPECTVAVGIPTHILQIKEK